MKTLWLSLLLACTLASHASAGARLTVIAHRGASGYLPEHTLEAKALAIGMGADFVEQDVVLTRDDVPIVTHDMTLGDVSDVASRFPGRARSDGHYYAIDFTLEELRTLRRRERVDDAGKQVFPKRFEPVGLPFAVVTLAEEIEFVRGVNRSLGRDVGLYTEIKAPAWHRSQGKDITKIVLDVLARGGYAKRADNIYLQCFDALELKRIRSELRSDLKLVQLIGENSWNESSTDYDAMMTPAGIADVATYADGVGPEISQLVEWPQAGSRARVKPLGKLVRAHGLRMHPYTLRLDSLPPNAPSAKAVLDALVKGAGADGIFTDFPDVAVRYRVGGVK